MEKISSAISHGLDNIDPLVVFRHSKVQCDEFEKICLNMHLGLKLSVEWYFITIVFAIGVGMFGCNCGGSSFGLFGNTSENSQQNIGK